MRDLIKESVKELLFEISINGFKTEINNRIVTYHNPDGELSDDQFKILVKRIQDSVSPNPKWVKLVLFVCTVDGSYVDDNSTRKTLNNLLRRIITIYEKNLPKITLENFKRWMRESHSYEEDYLTNDEARVIIKNPTDPMSWVATQKNKFSSSVESILKKFLSFLIFVNKIPSTTELKKIEKKNVNLIADSENYKIVQPLSHEASCLYGANTKWCTTSYINKEDFDKWTNGNQKLFYIIPKKANLPKFAFHLEMVEPSVTIYNNLDEVYKPTSKFMTENPELWKFIKTSFLQKNIDLEKIILDNNR